MVESAGQEGIMKAELASLPNPQKAMAKYIQRMYLLF
jgi:hypothetical protein